MQGREKNMAKADLLIKLVSSINRGDDNLYKKVVESIIADERRKNHHILADQLQNRLNQYVHKPVQKNGGQFPIHQSNSNSNIENFLLHIQPTKRLNDLVLDPSTLKIVQEFIQEHHRRDVLKSYNLEPRHSLLAIGAPGNGKTTLAEAIAAELMIPFYIVRYDGIIGSYLGETASRLKTLFEFIKSQECVIFFDEFDSIGKERGDKHETGEIKRVVSSLLFQIDNLPSYVITIGATNHPELLDRAVWRRFQVRIQLNVPDIAMASTYIDKFQQRSNIDFEYTSKTIATKLKGLSFAEIEEFCLDIQRKYVLRLPDSNVKRIIQECYDEVELRKI
ncbi:MAG: ATP-binding protein [Flavobacteriales bacterium]|nr:ATP-binding protein [Flavobacteriales bacterium]MCW8937602.1 ATP-binding protein [Flavobacteriales bacterium]MCW8968797.1 ATP-binding protein [Flavobacteriales bacterium]MCW8990090.1 ATP-binding protein [Flavobacteriales bacterium]MCW9019808.1 ATP-binding protein [Flavobacteriales bacterium]